MLKYLIRVVALLYLCVPTAQASHLVIPGTGESQMLLQGLVMLYAEEHPDHHVIIPDSVGSGGGVQAVIDGSALVGRTARPLKTTEAAEGLSEMKFATVAVTYVVHPSVIGVSNLSTEQIRDIYQGKITNWQGVGGPDHKIYVINREQGDANRDVLNNTYQQLAGFEPVGTYAYSNPEALEQLSENMYTIGYTSMASAISTSLKPLAINQISPADPEYPAAIPLYLVAKDFTQPEVKAFTDFLFTDRAKTYMRSYGVTPAK